MVVGESCLDSACSRRKKNERLEGCSFDWERLRKGIDLGIELVVSFLLSFIYVRHSSPYLHLNHYLHLPSLFTFFFSVFIAKN